MISVKFSKSQVVGVTNMRTESIIMEDVSAVCLSVQAVPGAHLLHGLPPPRLHRAQLLLVAADPVRQLGPVTGEKNLNIDKRSKGGGSRAG